MPHDKVIYHFIHCDLPWQRLSPSSDLKLLFHFKQSEESRLRDLYGHIIVAVTVDLPPLLHYNFDQENFTANAQFRVVFIIGS